jgi:hypothetical protein
MNHGFELSRLCLGRKSKFARAVVVMAKGEEHRHHPSSVFSLLSLIGRRKSSSLVYVLFMDGRLIQFALKTLR